MILVVGATGRLGGMIARQLLEQGKDVRILVRENSPSEALAGQGLATRAESLVEAGAEPVVGDLKDRTSLERALEGVEVVISTANSALRGGEDNPQTVEVEGNQRLVDVAVEAGVKHFIFVSAISADPGSPSLFLRGKALAEERLRASGMDYTILAPTAFMEVWPAMVVGMPAAMGQPVTLVGEGKHRDTFISDQDVAAFAVAVVEHPEARKQRLVIGGPDTLSWHDVVELYEQVLGRPIEVQHVAPGEPMPGLPEEMVGILAGMEMGDSVVDCSELARTFGVRQTPLEEVIRRSMDTAAER